MSHDCAYARQHYKVPPEVGRRVIVYGNPEVILANRGPYIGVVLDDDPKKWISNYHPNHERQYGSIEEHTERLAKHFRRAERLHVGDADNPRAGLAFLQFGSSGIASLTQALGSLPLK